MVSCFRASQTTCCSLFVLAVLYTRDVMGPETCQDGLVNNISGLLLQWPGLGSGTARLTDLIGDASSYTRLTSSDCFQNHFFHRCDFEERYDRWVSSFDNFIERHFRCNLYLRLSDFKRFRGEQRFSFMNNDRNRLLIPPQRRQGCQELFQVPTHDQAPGALATQVKCVCVKILVPSKSWNILLLVKINVLKPWKSVCIKTTSLCIIRESVT